MNWAKELGPDRKPILLPLPAGPTPNSTRVCPSQDGATNWFSSTYDPATGYYIVQTFEKCSIYSTRSTEAWQAGRGYAGGSQRLVPNEKPREILRALDITTGKVVWELPESGAANSWGGTLGFATGVLFFCEDGGMLSAVDARTGEPLWRFRTNAQWKASPMTYVFDGKQYVAVNAGQNIIAFGLPE
jgi:alcohol dehydrogenase (cytochrome c)